MLTLEEPSNLTRAVGPCRLIFWGMIVVGIDIQLDRFDIVNDFVGTLMILWGVVLLSRVAVSDRYQHRMAFCVVLAIFATIFSFFCDVLCLWRPELMPAPGKIVFALFIFGALVILLGVVNFCRCMEEYCASMNWDRALAGWRHSARWTTYSVLIPFAILAIPFFILLTSLEFFPKKPLPITWSSERIGDECRYTAERDGSVIYSTTVPRSADGSWHFSHPKLDPSQDDGVTFRFGEWFAPINGVFARSVMLPTILVMLFFCWTIIMILISLSRTIHADNWETVLHSVPE